MKYDKITHLCIKDIDQFWANEIYSQLKQEIHDLEYEGNTDQANNKRLDLIIAYLESLKKPLPPKAG